MKKTIITSLICSLTLISCKAQNTKTSLDHEINKWKNGLILSGELAPKCYDNFGEWIDDYPDISYAVTDEMKIFKTDLNNDKTTDAFVSMTISEPCNGGNRLSDDYSVLIFSNKGEYYHDVRMTEKIEYKILDQLTEMNIDTDYYRQNLLTFFDSFDGANVIGNVTIWTMDDAHCCPSYLGKFKYNLTTKKIKLEVTKNQ